MDKSIEATKENFSGIRTGRANPSFLNDIMIVRKSSVPLRPVPR